MRELTIEHGGEEFILAATFKASLQVADKVGDPIMIAREAALEAALLKGRIPYQPKFEFTVRNVPQLLHIGMNAARDGSITLERVQELTFEAGFIQARQWAADYLALIVDPKPSKPEVEPQDDLPAEEEAGNV